MLELLKKIGIPATVAAVIASVVTITPFIFKIDERYAKTEELAATAATTSRQIQDLTVEVSKLAGVQQTMLMLMAQGDRVRLEVPVPIPTVVPPPDEAASGARIPAPPPRPVSAAPIDFNAVQPSNAGAAKPDKAERATRFDEVSRELQRSQQRLQEIQKY